MRDTFPDGEYSIELMYDNDSKNISYTAGFFMLIAFVIAAMIFLQEFIVGPVWTSMTGKSISVLRDGLMTTEDANALKVIQPLTTIVAFLLPTLLTAVMLHRRPVKLLGFNTRDMQLKQLGLVILIIGTATDSAIIRPPVRGPCPQPARG
ncbi:MAG: hypothetical protein EOP49_20675, partial [Sphingobacteriales bacterium]